MSNLIEQPRFSCALAAQHSVLAIPRALPIVHAGPGCASKTFNFLAGGSGSNGEGYGGGSHISSTNTSEQEVVFGGEDKLRGVIDGALQVIDADLYVVLAGCTSGIVGDDVVSVSQEYADEGHPVVGAETSGFKGNNYYGHELVVNSIIDQYVQDAEPEVEKGLVNVFSVVPSQDLFWRGDLREIKRILEGIGLKVNILFGPESEGVSEWKNIPNAEFNLVINPWVGLSVAQHLEEKYGTPYLHYPILPVGAKATSKFLREVGEFAKIPAEKVEAYIKKEEDRYYSYIISLADFLTEYRNNIPTELYAIGDSAYVLGTSDYLVNELGFEPKGVYAIDDPIDYEYQAKVKEIADSVGEDIGNVFLINSDAGALQNKMRESIGSSHRAVILGSSWEDQLARENNNLLVHLSVPVADDVVLTRSFTGYEGGLRLSEEIYAGIYRKGKIAVTTQTLK